MIHRTIDRLLPVSSDQRMAIRLALEIVRRPSTALRRVNGQNLANFRRFRREQFLCCVCGKRTTPLYDFPDLRLRHEHRIGVLRETLQCRACGAPMRERSLAAALLAHLRQATGRELSSIADLAVAGLGGLRLLNTDNFSSMTKLLRGVPGYVTCSYLPQRPWGEEIAPGYYNIDLQRIDLPDESFDLLLTSDVMEHVRDEQSAHREIWRVLKRGGSYLFNVPYEESSPGNIRLVDTSGAEDVYLCEPQLHGDPLSGGILAYRVFGRELISQLESLGFSVTFTRLEQLEHLILNGDVFVARKQE